MTKGFWGIAKELTTGLLDISKEVAKETREGIKSYSKNATVEAQKHHLEHFEKMKNFEKRAKDAGISEESLARFIKELGIKQKNEDGPSGTGDSGGLLDIPYNGFGMLNETLIEAQFEQYIRHFNNNIKMYKEAVARNNGSLDRLKEILKDSNFTWSEIEAAADEGSSQKKL